MLARSGRGWSVRVRFAQVDGWTGRTGDNGGAHGVVTADTNTKEDTGDEDPEKNLIAGEVGGDRDADDGGDDDEDEFLSVDKRTTVVISEETKKELTDDTP
jgi:hypothetical protein